MPVSTDPTDQPITKEDAWFVGEDQSLQIPVSTIAGAVQNLTGWTMQFKMATTEAGASVLTKSVTLTSPTLGICTVATVRADTLNLTPGTYFYAVSRTDTGNDHVVVHGTLVLRGRPT